MIVAFRTDASLKIGTGHVMRCLTLANELKVRGAQCHFITRESAGGLLFMLREQDHIVHILIDTPTQNKSSTAHADWLEGDFKRDAEDTRKISETIHADWLVVDHYALDAEWEKIAKPEGIRLMAIDDLADRSHICGLLMDQNLGHSAEDYAPLTPPECRRLVGPRYALVRPEFAAKRVELKAERKNNWLACVGGLDPHDILHKIVNAWEQLPTPKPALTLVVGADSPSIEILKQRISGTKDITLHVQSSDMAALMADASLFIGTTGGISWERCCLGLPAIMGMVAENQRSNLEALAHRGAGIDIGDWREVAIESLRATFANVMRQPELLQRMAKQSAQLVDGKGAVRIATALMLDKIELRNATPTDAAQALIWRNAEETRRYSFDSGVIASETHQEWWAKSLIADDRSLLIAEIGNNPVGILRLDHIGEDMTVSIYIDPDLSGLGLGMAVLRAGINWSRVNRPRTTKLLARILTQNKASISIFRAAGFMLHNDLWSLEL